MIFSKILSKSLIVIGFLILLSSSTVLACDIDITVVGDEKESYEIGDEIILHVKVSYTHRVCSEGIKKTAFDGKGLKVLSGTDWKETSPGVWERKLKVTVQKAKKGKLLLSATRTCEKDGGFGTITLHSN